MQRYAWFRTAQGIFEGELQYAPKVRALLGDDLSPLLLSGDRALVAALAGPYHDNLSRFVSALERLGGQDSSGDGGLAVEDLVLGWEAWAKSLDELIRGEKNAGLRAGGRLPDAVRALLGPRDRQHPEEVAILAALIDDRNSDAHARFTRRPSDFRATVVLATLLVLRGCSERLRRALEGLVLEAPEPRRVGVLDSLEAEWRDHVDRFRGRADLLGQLCAQLRAPDRDGYTVVVSREGAGKSALLAKVSSQLGPRRRLGPGALRAEEQTPWLPGCVLYLGKARGGAVGLADELVRQLCHLALTVRTDTVRPPDRMGSMASPPGSDWSKARSHDQALRVNSRPVAVVGMGPGATDLVALRHLLMEQFRRAARELGRVTIVIDALDELFPGGVGLEVLPPLLPVGVRVLASTRPGPVFDALARHVSPNGLHRIELPLPTTADLGELAMQVGGDGASLQRATGGWMLHAKAIVDEARRGRPWSDALASSPEGAVRAMVERWEGSVGQSRHEGAGVLSVLAILARCGSVDLEDFAEVVEAVLERELMPGELRTMLRPVEEQLLDLEHGRVRLAVELLVEHVLDTWLGRKGLARTVGRVARALDQAEEVELDLLRAFQREWGETLEERCPRDVAALSGHVAGELGWALDPEPGARGELGRELLERSAEAGLAWPMIYLGSRLRSDGDEVAARGWFERAAEAGEPRGAALVADLDVDSATTMQAREDAHARLEAAAEGGDYYARLQLGDRLMSGVGCREDLDRGGRVLGSLLDDGDEGAFVSAVSGLVNGAPRLHFLTEANYDRPDSRASRLKRLLRRAPADSPGLVRRLRPEVLCLVTWGLCLRDPFTGWKRLVDVPLVNACAGTPDDWQEDDWLDLLHLHVAFDGPRAAWFELGRALIESGDSLARVTSIRLSGWFEDFSWSTGVLEELPDTEDREACVSAALRWFEALLASRSGRRMAVETWREMVQCETLSQVLWDPARSVPWRPERSWEFHDRVTARVLAAIRRGDAQVSLAVVGLVDECSERAYAASPSGVAVRRRTHGSPPPSPTLERDEAAESVVVFALGLPRPKSSWTWVDAVALVRSNDVLAARLAELQLRNEGIFQPAVSGERESHHPLTEPPADSIARAAAQGDSRAQLLGWLLRVEAAGRGPVALDDLEHAIVRDGAAQALALFGGIRRGEFHGGQGLLWSMEPLASGAKLHGVPLSPDTVRLVAGWFLDLAPEAMRRFLVGILVDDAERDLEASLQFLEQKGERFGPEAQVARCLLLLHAGADRAAEAATVFESLAPLLCGPERLLEYFDRRSVAEDVDLELVWAAENGAYRRLLRAAFESARAAVAGGTFSVEMEEVLSWGDAALAVTAGLAAGVDAESAGQFVQHFVNTLRGEGLDAFEDGSPDWRRAAARRALVLHDKLLIDEECRWTSDRASDLYWFLVCSGFFLDPEAVGVPSVPTLAARLRAAGVDAAALTVEPTEAPSDA